MVRLCVHRINEAAPYRVAYVDERQGYQFKTNHGVVYLISFKEDDLITSGPSAQVVVTNLNNRPSPRDLKVRDTLLAIVHEFFNANNAALLYICETGDGRQGSRARLFAQWFHCSPQRERFAFLFAHLTDEDGVPNFAAVFIRKDNPRLADMLAEFALTIQLLEGKG